MIIGAGNVATHLSRHLHSAGHAITCIYSRTLESASQLARETGCPATDDPRKVPGRADFFIICVPDRAISDVAGQFRDTDGIWLHTAGAVPLDVFQGIHRRSGVLYPLQTLTKERPLAEEFPLLLEGSDPEVTALIAKLASSLSGNSHVMNSSSRMVVHLAAVFANNFSNHMVHVAEQILEHEGMDPALLAPLLNETFRKVVAMGASGAQTGPAARGDQVTMQKHLALLKKHPEWEKLYTFISQDITGQIKAESDSRLNDDQF